MTHVLEGHRQELVDLCRKYRVRRLDVFGSAARSDFNEESSDVDLLIEFEDMPHADRADAYFGFLTAAQALLQRQVDLVEVAQYVIRTCVGELRNRESSSMPRDPRAWLADIGAACDLLIEFTRGKTFTDYAGESLLRSAVERQFEIVGEALRVALQHQPELAADITDARRSSPSETS